MHHWGGDVQARFWNKEFQGKECSIHAQTVRQAWHAAFWNREMTAAKADEGGGKRKDKSGGSPDPRELVGIYVPAFEG